MQAKISAVIPAYNEAARIHSVIGGVKDYFSLKKIPFEFVFVDDGSSDGTAEKIKEILGNSENYKILRHEKNSGKGAAVRTGMLAASGDWAVFMDADSSTPMKEFDKFIPLMEAGFQIVIGSRKTKGSLVEKKQKFLREFMGRGFTALSNLILGTAYTDFTCGFKCFRKDACAAVFSKQKIENWSYDSEILFLASKFGFKLAEVPVKWRNDPDTKVRLLRDSFGSFFGLIKIRLYDLTGSYE